jgi:hypothetical protein
MSGISWRGFVLTDVAAPVLCLTESNVQSPMSNVQCPKSKVDPVPSTILYLQMEVQDQRADIGRWTLDVGLSSDL